MKTFLLLFSSLLLGMCSNQSASDFDAKSDVNQLVSTEADMETPRSSVAPPPPSVSVTPRKLIRTANLVIEVNNYTKTRKDLEKILLKFDAQVSQESEQRQSYRIENNLMILVRPERLDSLILAIEQIAADIDSKTITSEDVTRPVCGFRIPIGDQARRYCTIPGIIKRCENNHGYYRSA